MSNWKRKLKRHVLDEPPRALILDERHVVSRPSPTREELKKLWLDTWPEARTALERGRAVHQALETMLTKGNTANEKENQQE